MFEIDLQSQLFEKLKIEAKMFGFQCNNARYVSDFRVLSDYELIYNLGGNTILITKDKTYSIGEGEILLIPRFCYHKIDTPKENLHTNYWIHFDMENSILSKNLIESIIKTWGGLTAKIGKDEYLISLYERILASHEKKNSFDFCLSQMYFKEIFLYILKKFNIQLESEKNTSNYLHSKVIDYVYNYYREISCVSQIASENNISTSYCNTIFQSNFGVSPAKFIVNLKLKEAETLLRNSDKSISEISDYLGFSNQYHFSNVFKNNYEVSPNKYRKLKFDY